jgi:predicted nucleic acid-binding protein
MNEYFYDSYAVIELVKGNPAYFGYSEKNVAISVFNIVEIYSSVLNDFGEETADKIYDKFKKAIVEVEDKILKEAVKFRKVHKKKNLSYTDCIGYIYAKRNGLKFLTGDKEFENLDNVEFVK